MRVFYLTKAKYALLNIMERHLKVARFSELNDPFELLGVDRSLKHHRSELKLFRKKTNALTGLLCFGRTWDNPVMWGHYADSHRGICLGFEVPRRHLKKVFYAKNLTQIRVELNSTGPLLNRAAKGKLLCTKFHDWNYEKEWRLLVKLKACKKDESGLHFLGFSHALKLCSVVLGPRCKEEIGAVRRLTKVLDPEIDVIKARLAYQSFRVVTNIAATKSS